MSAAIKGSIEQAPLHDCTLLVMPSRKDPVLILGAGAFGLSTALHLTNAGYTNITVLERADSIPSPQSAAYDLNKIVRAEYEDPFYTDLALEAIQEWKSDLFGPYFHQTGYIVATTGRAPEKAVHHLEAARDVVKAHPRFAAGIQSLDSAEAFRDLAWQFTGPLTGFTGYHNRLAGYAHSADAVYGLWKHVASRGVTFITGRQAGTVAELLYESQGSSTVCIGAKTVDGRKHLASTTVVALGSFGPALVPELSRFVVARSWSVAHVQLNKAECDYLRGIPTTNVRDLGFFFEPDPETRLFKICPLGAGFTNTNSSGVSVPPDPEDSASHDFIPAADEAKLRQLLREVFPWMADRPFVDKKLCWFADNADSDFCIDFVPTYGKSLIALSGDSGHGFKMMPVFGKWVEELMDAGKQPEKRWQWRNPKSEQATDYNAVSWRIGETKELREIVKEKHRPVQAKL